MADKTNVPWDDIPKPGSNFEPGIFYLFTIEDATIGMTKGEDGKQSKKMVNVMFRCVEPDEGAVAYEMYTLGDNDDPEALDPATFKKSWGARFLKDMLQAANVKLGTLEKTVERAKGATLEIIFKTEIDKRSGDPRTRPSSYYPAGTAKPGTSKSGKAAAGAQPPKSAPKPKPADEDEDEAPAPKAAKPKAPPAKAADYDDEDDD